MIWRDYIKLCDCRSGDEVKITAVINTSDDFLKFLNGKAIALGLCLKIEAFEPFDESMVVSYEGHKAETLSKAVTERLLVEKNH
jgi:DtxR family Mn-dependent transcriptional regulator